MRKARSGECTLGFQCCAVIMLSVALIEGSAPSSIYCSSCPCRLCTERKSIGHIFDLLLTQLGDPTDFELPDSLSRQILATNTASQSGAHQNTSVQGGIGRVFDLLVKSLGNPVDFELPDWFNEQNPAADTCVTHTAVHNVSNSSKIQDLFEMLLKQLGTPLEFELPDSLQKSMPAPCTSIKASLDENCNELRGAGKVFGMLIMDLGNPSDFELPDWLIKWKPAPYKSIKRNIYLTKKIKKRHKDDGIFCSCTPATGSKTVCGRDCHCGMLLSTCSSACKCGSSCGNKPFQSRIPKKMKLVQTEKCGSGIVADENIKRGEFIIEYVGEVIDDKTCEERLWKMKHRGETNFYLCEINRDMVIDATYKGNKSRYINHSCCPNTEMQKWSIDGEMRIGIFATRDIKIAEHLTYDYQRKLGVKPNKLKMPSSHGAFRHFTGQGYQNGGMHTGNATCQTSCRHNCIGEVVRINRVIRGVDSRVVDPRSCMKTDLPKVLTCQNRTGSLRDALLTFKISDL
ncbi:Histone-lysine N-methyltransferase ASHH3-like protein [Drosera capensis]